MSRKAAICIAALVFINTALSASAQAPPFLLKWGSPGDGDGEFNFPRRLAAAPDGTVYVADRNNSRIQKFTSTGVFITKWGSKGSGPGQFDYPFGVAVDATNTYVYTAERNNNRIQKFTNTGMFVTQWGSFGAGDGEFNYPIAVDVGANGSVYVGDAFNHRVQRFDTNGQFLGKWGSHGSATGQFINPIGIAVGNGNHVYVGDSGNHRVQEFTASGTFVRAWGVEGSGDGEFESPRGIGIDADGNVYVADTINSRIQKFTSSGVFLAKWGSFGTGDGQFNRPEDADIDGDFNVYIADASNNRIEKFGYAAVPVTLLALDAWRRGRQVVVRWSVHADMVEHVAFHVEREAGGARERLTQTELRGLSEYEYTDPDPPAGRPAYWIYEIDDNGNSYMHGPLVPPPATDENLLALSAFPNPFNPAVRITYVLPQAGRVRVRVCDVAGRWVSDLVDRRRGPGASTLTWDGRGSRGEELASGAYFVRLEFAGRIQTIRVVKIK